jgi:hypothetical protein
MTPYCGHPEVSGLMLLLLTSEPIVDGNPVKPNVLCAQSGLDDEAATTQNFEFRSNLPTDNVS